MEKNCKWLVAMSPEEIIEVLSEIELRELQEEGLYTSNLYSYIVFDTKEEAEEYYATNKLY